MNRDMRDMRYDGRNPYGSRGGYVVSSRGRRGRRGDRGMDYGSDMRDMRRGDRGDYADMRRDRGYSPDMGVGRQMGADMRGGYDMGYDGHYGRGGMQGYQPIEAMGYFNGYYGMPDHGDYGRGDYGRGRDYGYDMRREYGDYRDYGDYGETLSEKEIEEWCHKLKNELSEQERQMFSKEMITQKARQMNLPMEKFGEKELEVTTLMMVTDYKDVIGANPDTAIRLAYAWLTDKDVAVKGAEKLAVYYDCIVEGE